MTTTAEEMLRAYGNSANSSATEIIQIADVLLDGPDCDCCMWATGVGKSALVAQKFVGTMRSYGMMAHFIHPVDGFHGDSGALGDYDSLVAVSASGSTPETIKMARYAKDRGLPVVSCTGMTSPPSELECLADHNLYSLTTSWDAGDIPSASFYTACAVLDALAVALAGPGAELDHPGGAIGDKIRAGQA